MNVEGMNKILILFEDDIAKFPQDIKNMRLKLYFREEKSKIKELCEEIKPDLIISNIDLIEEIKVLKLSSEYRELPVIFVINIDQRKNREELFKMHNTDYILDDFEKKEISSKIELHLRVDCVDQKSRELERLYSNINMLMKFFSVLNYAAYMKSVRIKNLVKKIMNGLGIENNWEIKLAASLSHIGCNLISPEVLEKLFRGEEASRIEQQYFLNHPLIGATIISKISHLEDVAEMVENQLEPLGDIELDLGNKKHLGIQILNAAIRYDMGLSKGLSHNLIIENMHETGWYNEKIIEILKSQKTDKKRQLYKEISIGELQNGMILGEDILFADRVIVKKFMPLNDLIREHLLLLNKIGGIENTIRIVLD